MLRLMNCMKMGNSLLIYKMLSQRVVIMYIMMRRVGYDVRNMFEHWKRLWINNY